MGKRSKRRRQLAEARETKRMKRTDEDVEELDPGMVIREEMEYNSEEDVEFVPDLEEFNEEVAFDCYSNEWIESLSRDDVMSLTILLLKLLVHRLQMGVTESSKIISELVNYSDRSIREWRSIFIDNEGVFPDSQQGSYQRSGVLWQNEELNKCVRKFVRENGCVKGKKNMTCGIFCHWVNESLLVNRVLEPGYPRKISLATARRWLHNLGFQVIKKQKGTYVDGHERIDVVEYRNKYLRKMVALGFLNESNAPTPDATKNFPTDLEALTPQQAEKNIVFFHDESTFQANDDETWIWGERGQHVLKPKSRGSGIMVSDFIDERNGYLRLTDDEFEIAKATHPSLRRQAREFLEYGKEHEGYWTAERSTEGSCCHCRSEVSKGSGLQTALCL